jgi:glucose/arabinose dehydrogenase
MGRSTPLWLLDGDGCSCGRYLVIRALVACLLWGTPRQAPAQAPRSPTLASVPGTVRVQMLAQGLEHPWALVFLPDGRLLVTERPGRPRRALPQRVEGAHP